MKTNDKEAVDDNYVSIGFWLFSFLIMAFPFVNILMTIYWAFSGNNQSRKNFFRAVMLLWVIFITFLTVMIILGNKETIQNFIKGLGFG